ncbi:MAG: cation:proton antiporter [Verrucomicrobiales bacterium]|jgi:CPA1 family monovalent cation:H+ antiporter|tara:strand:+ start:28069 stop:29325 length:1257 start_codon:yes stop_codon:yes gene_type:complete
MNLLDTAAVLLSLAAIFGYINHRVFKLPTSIGILLIGLVLSVLILLLGDQWPGLVTQADYFVTQIDFNETVMGVMLSFLLFAGALHVNLGDLRDQKGVVAMLASVGLVVSTFLVGTSAYFIFQWFGVNLSYLWCLVFGALISPTDPVAVLGILKKAKVPKSLETKITGESLFNDGVGVVIYLALVGLAAGTREASIMSVGDLFLKEVGGGILLGGVLGFIAYWMLKTIDNYQVEILITLALVMGGYQLASAWHLSGPLAMVVAGLMIGNQGRLLAMSDTTRHHLDLFWELIDEVLNALLFLLLGLEIFVLNWSGQAFSAGLILIFVVLGARMVAVTLPVIILRKTREFSPGVIRILTWGGLRGGISVALALALPKEGLEESGRQAILMATYLVVIFSIAVQGLTLRSVVDRLLKREVN